MNGFSILTKKDVLFWPILNPIVLAEREMTSVSVVTLRRCRRRRFPLVTDTWLMRVILYASLFTPESSGYSLAIA